MLSVYLCHTLNEGYFLKGVFSYYIFIFILLSKG